jgi:hypothetical protein
MDVVSRVSALTRPIEGSNGSLAALVAPEHLRAALVPCQYACQHEQQVRQAVEVTEYSGGYDLRPRKGPGASLRPPRYCAREVAGGGGRTAPGEDELLERGQCLVEAIQGLLEAHHMLGRDRPVAGDAKLAPQVEELMLRFDKAIRDLAREFRHGEHDPDRAIELIHGAVGFDPRTVFRHTAAIAQARGASIAGSCVDPA